MLSLRASLQLALALGVASSALSSRSAAAQEARACIDASIAGQRERDRGAYRAARASFVACARESCPSPVRRDCSQWLTEIDAAMPSILVAATDAQGRDLDQVRVALDGQPLLARLDGMPIAVDPGLHRLRCQTADGNAVDVSVLVRAGEKNRVIQARFGPGSPLASRRPAAVADAGGRSHAPVFAAVLGGVAAVAFASEAYFGVRGIQQRDRDTAVGACAPGCPASEKTGIETKFAVADLSLGVGVVAAGAAVYFLIRALTGNPDVPGKVLVGPPEGAAATPAIPVWRF